jgi:hypothetical protein
MRNVHCNVAARVVGLVVGALWRQTAAADAAVAAAGAEQLVAACHEARQFTGGMSLVGSMPTRLPCCYV